MSLIPEVEEDFASIYGAWKWNQFRFLVGDQVLTVSSLLQQ